MEFLITDKPNRRSVGSFVSLQVSGFGVSAEVALYGAVADDWLNGDRSGESVLMKMAAENLRNMANFLEVESLNHKVIDNDIAENF